MVNNAATEVDLETWNCIFQSKLEELQRPERWILGLHEDAEPGRGWRQYTLHAFASFKCSTCDRWWESAKVRIIFHIRQAFYRGEENLVNMRIFKQACQSCNTATLEEPEFLIENIAVAMDRLVTRILMKCYDEDVSDRPVSAFITNERQGGVHDTTNCEACRLGLCHIKLKVETKDGPPATGQGSHLNDKRRSLMAERQIVKVSQQQEVEPPNVWEIGQRNQEARKREVQPATGESSHFYDLGHSQEIETPNIWETRQRNQEVSKGGVKPTMWEGSHFDDLWREQEINVWKTRQQNQEASMGEVQPTMGDGSDFDDLWRSQERETPKVWQTRQQNQEASMGGVQPTMGQGSHFYDVWSSLGTDTDIIWGARQQNHKKTNTSIGCSNTNSGTAATRSREENRSRSRLEIKCCPCVLL